MPQIIYLDLSKQDNAKNVKQLIQCFPSIRQFSCGEPYVFIDKYTAAQTIFILDQILLLLPKTSPSQEQPFNNYAVIEYRQPNRELSSILERPILGIWTINEYKATFENKSTRTYECVLKTAFFTAMMADNYEYRHHVTKARLIQTQEISNTTPHMYLEYPPIEGIDGVHLLMQQYRAIPIKTLSLWLRENPQGLTFIQRLLICIDLYRMYDQARLFSAQGPDELQLIHRDANSTNIKVTNNDYMLSSYTDGLRLATPPDQAKKTDDLCSLALICAELWGDSNSVDITSREELIKAQYFFESKELLPGMPEYSDEQRDDIQFILMMTAITPEGLQRDQSERKVKHLTDTMYIHTLQETYKKLSTPDSALQNTINALKIKLNGYHLLSPELRAQLDKEFVAADFLIHHPQALANRSIDQECSLADIWTNYCQNQLKSVLSMHCADDTPSALMTHVARIKKACTYPLMPNHHILQSILAEWPIIIRLVELFKRVQCTDTETISTLFNTQLQASNTSTSNLSDIEAAIKQSIIEHLTHRLGLDQSNHPYQHLFIDLCNRAAEPATARNHIIDIPFADEWAMALQLKALAQNSNSLNPPGHDAVAPAGALVNLWYAYRDEQQTLIQNTKLLQDTPSKLLMQLAQLKKKCTDNPLAPQILPSIIAQFTTIKGLFQLFQRLKFINSMQIAAFFNTMLAVDSHIPVSQLKCSLQKYLHAHLQECCITAQLPNQYHKLVLNLATEAVELTDVSAIDFSTNWLVMERLLYLNELCVSLGIKETSQATTPLSLASIFDVLYCCYQHHITTAIDRALASYNKGPQSPPSPGLFAKAPQRKQAIEQLYSDVTLLFLNGKTQVQTIPQSIISLVEKTQQEVQHHHQQGILGSLQLTQSKLARALEHFLIEFKQSHKLVQHGPCPTQG